MFIYKINVMESLAEKGFTANRLRKEKILSEATMQNIRHGKNITLETLNILCVILRCQPSDIIEIQPTDAEKIKFF
ncbi:MAG: helix-turn-helix domain-containing protein [Acetatifactor sp.]|nr:helix-turn-helix domain-containing protein [Acetatifactor sp.]